MMHISSTILSQSEGKVQKSSLKTQFVKKHTQKTASTTNTKKDEKIDNYPTERHHHHLFAARVGGEATGMYF